MQVSNVEVKSGAVAVYLGNRVVVDSTKLSVNLDQTHYVDELLEGMYFSRTNRAEGYQLLYTSL